MNERAKTQHAEQQGKGWKSDRVAHRESRHHTEIGNHSAFFLGLRRSLGLELSRIEIPDCLLNFRSGVHHERAVARDGLMQSLRGNQQETRAG